MRESLTSATACSASATLITGSVGPKVSSTMQSIVWSTSASSVGAVEAPGPGDAVAADAHARALGERVGDVRLDDLRAGAPR